MTSRNLALLKLRAVQQLRVQRRKMSNYAFLFPGQGSQAVGMTSEIEDSPAVGEIFHTAERVLDYDLRSICLQGPRDVLDQTVHCQPAVVVASLAALEDLKIAHPPVTTPTTTPIDCLCTFNPHSTGVFELQSGCWLQCWRIHSANLCWSSLAGARCDIIIINFCFHAKHLHYHD